MIYNNTRYVESVSHRNKTSSHESLSVTTKPSEGTAKTYRICELFVGCSGPEPYQISYTSIFFAF